MDYKKPEVDRLGDATTVIELISRKPAQRPFDPGKTVSPAYDLDE